jgi:hypothetical protein
MKDTEIYSKIEEIYATEKGKKFISHLLKSFFPAKNSQYIADSKNKKMRCCITGTPLVSRSQIMGAVMKVTPEEFSNFLRQGLNLGEGADQISPEHPVKRHLPNGAVLGIQCKDSNKYICQPAYQQLYNFLATRLLQGDKNISWLANKIVPKDVYDDIKSSPYREAIEKNNKPSSMKLGELSILQQLKEQLQKEEGLN